MELNVSSPARFGPAFSQDRVGIRIANRQRRKTNGNLIDISMVNDRIEIGCVQLYVRSRLNSQNFREEPTFRVKFRKFS